MRQGEILVCVATAVVACLVLAAPARAWTHCGDCWCANGNQTCPTWEPTNYTADFVAAFKSHHPSNPYTLSCNPYTNSSCETTPPQTLVSSDDAVCGRVYASNTGDNCSTTYELRTFPNADAATVRGVFVGDTRVHCALGVLSQHTDVLLAVFRRLPAPRSHTLTLAACAPQARMWVPTWLSVT